MTSLDPRLLFGDLDLTDYPYALEFGRDMGGPEVVYATLSSMLADGEIVSADRVSNRQVSFSIVVEGADLQELADAEAALIAECDKASNTLTLDPGDGVARATVFDTWRASPRQVNDDDMESSLVRRYTLSIPALPYGRSSVKTTDDAAAPPTSGGSLLYGFESTTGWATTLAGHTGTYSVDTVVFTEGTGSIKSTPVGFTTYPATGTVRAQTLDKLSGLSLSTGLGGYLSVAVRTSFPLAPQVNPLTIYVTTTTGGRTLASPLLATSTDANGFVRYTWQVAAGLTITALEFNVAQTWPSGSTGFVWYDDLRLATAATTENQISKVIEVGGSVRAPGSIHVASPSDAVPLGNVLVATVHEDDVPAGFRPDMRRWVTAGSTSADATALGGSYYSAPSDYGSGVQFEAPVSQFAAGNHAVVVLAKLTGGADPVTLGVETQLTFAGTATGGASATDVPAAVATTGWVLVPCGTVAIPTVDNPTSTTEIRVRPKGGVPVAEIFLIPEAADFTLANCGTGTVSASGAASHLWLDSPEPANNGLGAWWRGPTGDKANRRRLNLVSELTKPGRHMFKPGNVLCWCLATGASGPFVTLEFYKHWFGHVAED